MAGASRYNGLAEVSGIEARGDGSKREGQFQNETRQFHFGPFPGARHFIAFFIALSPLTDMNLADGPVPERLLQRTPLGRFGTDAEVASIVAYLAKSDAAFIAGASLTVDGGYIA